MARYYFHLEDGPRDHDRKGMDLPDRHAAEQAAIRYAGEVLKDEPSRLSEGRLNVVVSDENDDEIMVVSVKILKS